MTLVSKLKVFAKKREESEKLSITSTFRMQNRKVWNGLELGVPVERSPSQRQTKAEPQILEEIVSEKVNDSNCYTKLKQDPRAATDTELFALWMKGKAHKLVTQNEAKLVMGITDQNRKSTSSVYKYGTSYFSPSLKIHKLKPAEIQPGCKIPARLILAAQDGVTKRSDVFIQQKWLNDLQKDYCEDLVTDTISTLQWLDHIENTTPNNTKKSIHPFTFDFKSLYDTISPALVKEALLEAMSETRKNWSENFKTWLVDLCMLSVESCSASKHCRPLCFIQNPIHQQKSHGHGDQTIHR